MKRFAARLRSARKMAGVAYKRGFVIPILVALQFLAPATEAFAVGGLSNSKVNVLNADTVTKEHIEIEPFFSLEFVDDGNKTIRFGGGFRATPGLLDNLEAGVNINYLNIEDSALIRAESNFGDIEAGVKFRFFDEGKGIPFSLAYQGGLTFPVGSGALWIVHPGGLILTKNFTDTFSMDADFVFGIIEHGSWSFVTDVGFGYFLRPWFQPVIEAALGYQAPDGSDGISTINVTAGFTSPATDWLTVIVGVTPDVYVRNTDRLIVITAAFTFFF